jgi:hypothetical protein
MPRTHKIIFSLRRGTPEGRGGEKLERALFGSSAADEQVHWARRYDQLTTAEMIYPGSQSNPPEKRPSPSGQKTGFIQ